MDDYAFYVDLSLFRLLRVLFYFYVLLLSLSIKK